MLGSSRRQRILEQLAERQQVRTSDLAHELDTSIKTIGRDLEMLERVGQARRVHGGAISLSVPHLPPVARRLDLDRRAKDAAATRAASLITGGSFVFLGGGSTMLSLAVRLFDLSVRTSFVTTMLDIALILGREGRHDVRMPAGVLDSTSRCLGGPDCYRFLESCAFDFAVMGTTGIDPERGVMGPTADHVSHVDSLRRGSHRLMAVVDASKFGKTDRYRVCGLSDLQILVCDRPVPPEFRRYVTLPGLRLVDDDPIAA